MRFQGPEFLWMLQHDHNALRRYVDTEEEETTMIAMQIADLQQARAAIASGGHAYSSSYTHCEVRIHVESSLSSCTRPVWLPRGL